MRCGAHSSFEPSRLQSRRRSRLATAALVAGVIGIVCVDAPRTVPRVGPIRVAPTGPIGQHERLELTFDISDSAAARPQWPFDAAPPRGIPPGVGISVDAVFTDPAGRRFSQPAFYAEEFEDEVRDGRDWHLPTGRFAWKTRFSPNRTGRWSYKIVAVDARGTSESETEPFDVIPSARRGLVRVSKADSRYFEYEDGSPFPGLGIAAEDFLGNPLARGASDYATLAANGVDFVRVWISSVFGSAWNNWVGGRNQYRGYLPVTGLTPFEDRITGRTTLTMKLDYEPDGDTGWFDACRMQFFDGHEESIRPRTSYRIRIGYFGAGIVGPRRGEQRAFGLVAKLGGWFANCHEPGTGTVVTTYGRDTNGLEFIEGRWNSENHNFLPRLHLGLENVRAGAAFVQSVSLREELANGGLGPELMIRPSMEHQLYIPDEKAYSLDKIVEVAERHGVRLKLVLMDHDDKVYAKMANDGSWAGADNAEGFYGQGRLLNRTRWLQQMWWRYAQARWGYSPSVHSWELTNEGDPNSVAHYELADEFGKFMHCRVFGVEPGRGDGAACRLQHPNAHLVTTSFWKGFPASEFWGNRKYPNIDYADLHAYVSTSTAPDADRQAMQSDAAYLHTWHSQYVSRLRVGKPVVRGETGLDAVGAQQETALGLERDRDGVWLHNFLWSGLDSGGMYELYWWGSHLQGRTFDHRSAFRGVRAFLTGIPLNRGGYVDWGGTVTHPALRVVGQKNAATRALHLWVQHREHTWRRVVEGSSISPVSGQVLVPGFTPGSRVTLERWDTYAIGGRVVDVLPVIADSTGTIRIDVQNLRTDVAFRSVVGSTVDADAGRPTPGE